MSERRWHERNGAGLKPASSADPSDPPAEPSIQTPMQTDAPTRIDSPEFSGSQTQAQPGNAEMEDGASGPDLPARERNAADETRQMEESLDNALSSLERMLDRQPELPFGLPEPDDAAQAADRDAMRLPVLDNVVVPGRAPNPTTPLSELDIEAPTEAALRRRIAARLASEIDIIVQARVEAALEQLHDQIRRRVTDHIDIMLPEIVDELHRSREHVRRDDDGEE